MPALNQFNMGRTRFTQAFDGVAHWYGTQRAAVIIQTNQGVYERLRNAYYHDFPTHAKYYLLDPAQPAWLERVNLDGSVENYYAAPTNDEDTAPTWVRVQLMESTRYALFQNLEVTGDITHVGKHKQTGNMERTGDTTLTGKVTHTGDYELEGDLTQVGDTEQTGDHVITGALSSTEPYTNTVPQGIAPMVITSDTKVANLNADTVDGVHLETTATPNTLLPLNEQAKFPNTVLTATDTVDSISTANANTQGGSYSQTNVQSIATLANATKVTVNAILVALKNANLMSS